MKPRGALLFFTLLIPFVFAGCATKPSTQWWRVGNCLVLYDQSKEEKQVVSLGQGWDIKRDTIAATGAIQKYASAACLRGARGAGRRTPPAVGSIRRAVLSVSGRR